jgi:DNA-binding LacI/PurR family transcriptional regulator
LTTISQPIVEKGRLAARLIFEAGRPRTEILEVKLVERASTARPRP